MKVEHARDLGKGHSAEIDAATWNPEGRSLRNRYATVNGGFNPDGSSEVPIGDLVPMLQFAGEHDALTAIQCAAIVESLSASNRRPFRG